MLLQLLLLAGDPIPSVLQTESYSWTSLDEAYRRLSEHEVTEADSWFAETLARAGEAAGRDADCFPVFPRVIGASIPTLELLIRGSETVVTGNILAVRMGYAFESFRPVSLVEVLSDEAGLLSGVNTFYLIHVPSPFVFEGVATCKGTGHRSTPPKAGDRVLVFVSNGEATKIKTEGVSFETQNVCLPALDQENEIPQLKNIYHLAGDEASLRSAWREAQ